MRVKEVPSWGRHHGGEASPRFRPTEASQTVLQDIDRGQLDAAVDRPGRASDKQVGLEKTRATRRTGARSSGNDHEPGRAADAADLVIEAAPEKIELKLQIFRGPGSDHEAGLRPGVEHLVTLHHRDGGRDPPAGTRARMHFFNPVPRMSLVEIVRALETDELVIDTALESRAACARNVSWFANRPAFITSRINAMIGNEAFYLLQEGVATPGTSTRRSTGAQPPDGTLRTRVISWPDTRLAILQYLHQDARRKNTGGTPSRAVRESRTSGEEGRAGSLRVRRRVGGRSASGPFRSVRFQVSPRGHEAPIPAAETRG